MSVRGPCCIFFLDSVQKPSVSSNPVHVERICQGFIALIASFLEACFAAKMLQGRIGPGPPSSVHFSQDNHRLWQLR